MSKYIEVDPNFLTDNMVKDGMVFFDAKTEPFKIFGVTYENGLYRRMPEEVARSVSQGVYDLHTNTAGGRVRFKTNIQKPTIMASSPITSCQIDGERMETVTDFIFLGSKITADGDRSLEIKRCLLLGRRSL